MTQPWIAARIALHEDIVAGERRFNRQCLRVAQWAEYDAVTAKDEMLLTSHRTTLILLRTHPDALLEEAQAKA